MLIALAARIDAAPADEIDLAIRYANALTGGGPTDEDDDIDDIDSADNADDTDVAGDADDAGDGRRGVSRTGSLDRRAVRGLEDDRDGDALAPRVRLRAIDDDPAEGDGDERIAGPGSFASVAILDTDPVDPGTAMGGDASIAATQAGAAETYESWMRHQRPSRFGRLDLGLAWRHRVSDPLTALPHSYDEIWLVATWRR